MPLWSTNKVLVTSKWLMIGEFDGNRQHSISGALHLKASKDCPKYCHDNHEEKLKINSNGWSILQKEKQAFDLVHRRTKDAYLLCYLFSDVTAQTNEHFTVQPTWAKKQKKNEQETVLYTIRACLAHSYDAPFLFHKTSGPTSSILHWAISGQDVVCLRTNTSLTLKGRSRCYHGFEKSVRENGLVVTYVRCKSFPHSRLDICKWSDFLDQNTCRRFDKGNSNIHPDLGDSGQERQIQRERERERERERVGTGE